MTELIRVEFQQQETAASVAAKFGISEAAAARLLDRLGSEEQLADIIVLDAQSRPDQDQ